MKFTAAAMASLAAVASAVSLTNSNYDIVAGKPFTITWTDADGPVTITLKNGETTNLQTVEVLDSSDSGTSFTWTPPSDLPTDTYALEITDSSGTPNYSPQFQFAGSASATTSAAASTSAAESTTASAQTTITTAVSTTTESSSASAATTSGSSSSSSSSSSSTTSTSASSTSASASATSTPQNTNNSQRLGSPLALVFVTIAALLYFN